MLGWDSPRVRATSMGVPSGVRFMYLSCSWDMICTVHGSIHLVTQKMDDACMHKWTYVADPA